MEENSYIRKALTLMVESALASGAASLAIILMIRRSEIVFKNRSSHRPPAQCFQAQKILRVESNNHSGDKSQVSCTGSVGLYYCTTSSPLLF